MSAARASRVLLLGYGEMGHAMQQLLADRHELRIWNRHPVPGLPPVQLEQAVPAAEFVIFCVPVTPLAEVSARVRPYLQADSVSLSMAKGLDAAGRTAPQILGEAYTGKHNFGVLYGPMIAEEIRAGRPAYAQLGVSDEPVIERVAALFAGSRLALSHSEDLYGIAWASVLKNVYSMLFGAADALRLGDNVRGYLVVRALSEMETIVGRRGGVPATARQLAGLGDLVTTATSSGSHHRALGAQLVRGMHDLGGEGIHTLDMVRRFNLFSETEFPLFSLARRLVEQPAAAADAMHEFLHTSPAL